MSTLIKVLLGFVFLVLGAWAIIAWWQELTVLVKGSIGIFLVFASVICFAIAKE